VAIAVDILLARLLIVSPFGVQARGCGSPGACGVPGRSASAVLAQSLVHIAQRHAIAPDCFAVTAVCLVDQSKDSGESAVGLAPVAVLDTDRATPTLRNGPSGRIKRDQRRSQELAGLGILNNEDGAARGALEVSQRRRASTLWALGRRIPICATRRWNSPRHGWRVPEPHAHLGHFKDGYGWDASGQRASRC